MKVSAALFLSALVSLKQLCYGDEKLRGSTDKYQVIGAEDVEVLSDGVDGLEVRAVHKVTTIDGVDRPNTDFYVKNKNSKGETLTGYARCYVGYGSGYQDVTVVVKINQEAFVCNTDYNYILIYGESSSCMWADPNCIDKINGKCYFRDYIPQNGCENTCTDKYKAEGCPKKKSDDVSISASSEEGAEDVEVLTNGVDGLEVRAVHKVTTIDGVDRPNTDFYVKNKNSKGETLTGYARCYVGYGSGYQDHTVVVKINQEAFICNTDYNYILIYGESSSCMWADPNCIDKINGKCYFRDYIDQNGCANTCSDKYKAEGCPKKKSDDVSISASSEE